MQSISAPKEGSLPENTASWQARKSRIVVRADEKPTAFLELAALTADLQKVSAQLEASKPVPHTVLNNQ